MEDKGEIILRLGKKKVKFNVWVDENMEKGRIIFNPEDFASYIESLGSV